jgi:hypothetical protein
MLVNPRKSFDDKMNLRGSISKLVIDHQNPTAYDLDRLEAIGELVEKCLAAKRVGVEVWEAEIYERIAQL